jgi:hypothetical protein
MFVWERSKRAICFAIVLNEDIIPNFDDVGIILVDKMGSLTTSYPVVVYFTCRVLGIVVLNGGSNYLQGPQGPVAPISENIEFVRYQVSYKANLPQKLS